MSTGLMIVLVFVSALFIWKVGLAVFPNKRCRYCEGKGFRGMGNVGRPCRPCSGAGYVKRIGAK